MTTTPPDFDPLALVDSFYGPGAFCGWILSVLAIGITWASNLDSHQDDKISVDFIIALSFPCAAAAHFLRLLATMSDEVNLYQHSGYSDPNNTIVANAAVAQYVAAAEAPLRICQSFMPVYYCLYQVAQSRHQTKRLGYTVLVGLFVYLAKLLIYVRSEGERPAFFSTKSPALTWGFSEPFYLLMGAESWWTMSATQEGPPKQALPVASNQSATSAVLIINIAFSLVHMSLPATPGNGFLDLTPSFGPLPTSLGRMLDMDQFAALASGGLMVLFNIREAIMSRRISGPDMEGEGKGTASHRTPADRVTTGLGASDADQLVFQRRNGGQGEDDGDIASFPLQQLD
ncbi:uncharacterized protein DNG_09768 [Cephalotrichum gorgonifer]|uniref:Uncharacterized protein n=1 Tax=Cephalotrichum gorgonifer TaxID=2041049 RepID=A0AAE8N7F0_9PEZI|nr:uncharacterized protein DNG_09768 [Cephalotrichum gorgonifer]